MREKMKRTFVVFRAFAVFFGDSWHPQLVLDSGMQCQQFIQLLEKSLARKPPTRTRIIIVVITGHCRTDSVKDALARSFPSYQFSISSDFRKQLKSITIHPLSSVSVSWVLPTNNPPKSPQGRQNPWIVNDDQPKLISTADFPADKILSSICTDCCCSVADFLSDWTCDYYYLQWSSLRICYCRDQQQQQQKKNVSGVSLFVFSVWDLMGMLLLFSYLRKRQWTSSFQDGVVALCVCVCVFSFAHDVCLRDVPGYSAFGHRHMMRAWWEHVFHEPLSLRIWITLDKSLYFLTRFGLQERPRRRRRRRANKDKKKKKTSAAFQEERGSER